jgi:hypothetical protein
MPHKTNLKVANHYVFKGTGVSGSLDTTTLIGQPAGSVTVDDHDAQMVIERNSMGWIGTAPVDAAPDAFTRSVVIVVPEVNADADGEKFDGLAIIVTHRTSIGGPGLVKGALEEYDVREISGTASAVQS